MIYNNIESEGGINGQKELQSDDRRRVQELLKIHKTGETNGKPDIKGLYGIEGQKGVTEQEIKEILIDYANKIHKSFRIVLF